MNHQHDERAAGIAGIDAMLRRLTWQHQKHVLQILGRPEIGLTLPQTMTLFAIRAAHTCRMSELAEVTHQSAGTLTGIVDRLIEEGLVNRVRDLDDRRVVQVMLSAEGERRLTRVEQALQEEMAYRLRDFSTQQIGMLCGLLSALMESYQELGSEARAAVVGTA